MKITRSLTVAATLLACAGAHAAAAQEKPLYLPARDVMVTYRLTGTSQGGREAHMYFSAALNKLRLDEPSQKGYAVIDRAAQQMVVVMTQARAYTSMPFDPQMAGGFILNDKMSFTRTGTNTIAGLSCTRWNVTAERASGAVCVTADGVILSGQGRQRDGGSAGLEATAVTYGPQPASLFEPPRDFARIAAPVRPK